MRSTDQGRPLALSYRRAEVAGFWIVTTSMVCLLLTVTAVNLRMPTPWLWGGGGVVALLLPRLVWRHWFENGIWLWNGCVRRVAALLRRYVLAVSYFVLLAAVGRWYSLEEGSRGEANGSQWTVRPPISTPASTVTGPGDRWYDGLRAGTQHPQSLWAVCLVPIVLLLRILGDQQQQSQPSSSSYTLY